MSAAVDFVREYIDRDSRALHYEIKRRPSNWWMPYQNWWGRQLMTAMREHGLEVESQSYVALVEEAVRQLEEG